MIKRNNIIRFFIVCMIVAIFVSGVYLSIDFRKTTNFAQAEIIEADSTHTAEPVVPELILKDDADFMIDRFDQFSGFSADARKRIESVETFGIIVPAKVDHFGSSSSSPFKAYANKLISVEFAADTKITKIAEFLFINCSGLKSITIPNGFTSIDYGAFYNCKGLENVIISQDASLQSIGEYAFWNCSSLTEITIPDNVTSIGQDAFFGCSSLTSLTIPENATDIGGAAFMRCSGLETITINANLQNIPDSVFSYCSSLTSINIPNSVTRIEISAFQGCSGLKNITIPEGVTSIGQQAFFQCESLASINIPSSVTKLDYFVFGDCPGLQSITVADGNQNYKDYGQNVIVDTTSNILMLGCVNSKIPNEVVSIGSDAFHDCTSLTSITIPENVTSIDSSAFWNCSSLTSITIPESVTSIGSFAFGKCSSLTSITIPENVASIGKDPFEGCDNVLIIAANKEKATTFQTDGSFNLTSYQDRITYVVEIQFKNNSESITQKKLYKQDITWCLQENGVWEQDYNYQLPYSQEGSWCDEEGNTVTLSELNDKLKDGGLEDGYILNFQEDVPSEQQPANSNLLWILLGVLGGVMVVLAILILILVLHKKKQKRS